jgi:hypothetical protein
LGRARLSGLAFGVCLVVSVASTCGATVLFSDDSESGNLDRWNLVTGSWIVEEEEGNHYARTDGGPFRIINIAGRTFDDITITARMWHVSKDHGANIYARNDGARSGYWFGISGPLDAAGWGMFHHGGQTIEGVLVASSPLDTWVTLEVTMTGRSATMSAVLEGGGVLGETAFDIPDIADASGLDMPEGFFGFIVAGAQVRIDDVVVTGDADSVAVQPEGSAAMAWGSLKTAP